MNRGGGGGGRGRGGGGSSARSTVSTSTATTSASIRGRRATDRHDVLEYNELFNYVPDEQLNEEDLEYYNACKNDLRITLLVNKGGVRVRDIRSQFRNNAGYDIDLDRLKLTSWVHFLVSCQRIVDLQLDSHPLEDKETLYAFISGQGRRDIHDTTRDMQSMINCTPDDGHGPSRMRLIPMTAREAFVKGFLDPADGVPRVDPRVPIQDLGVAASETLRRMKKKLTFEEQIALAKAKQARGATIMTVETTDPEPDTQTSSVESVFDWMDQLQAKGGVATTSNLGFPKAGWAQ